MAVQGQRDEGGVDEELAAKEAQDLYDVSVLAKIRSQSSTANTSM